MAKITNDELLKAVGGNQPPSSDQFKELVCKLDNHQILAKVFILEGDPSVFENSPMKYMVFREQVADRFGIGSQDVSIVGSAKLGFSPSPYKFGKPFAETSDVDVVIISEKLFQEGSRELFSAFASFGPQLYQIRPYLLDPKEWPTSPKPVVELDDWRKIKEAVRNYVYGNFNPGLLPMDNELRKQVFDAIASTAGLFLALEPKVFVSKIRCRVFRTWKDAEAYYTNSLRELKNSMMGQTSEPMDEDIEEAAQVLAREDKDGSLV